MMKSILKYTDLFIGIGFALMCMNSDAPARQWSKDPHALAHDYLYIMDTRQNNELVMLWWFAPPMINQSGEPKTSDSAFENYVILGTIHAHISSNGNMAFDPPEPISVDNVNGKELVKLNENTIPPTVSGVLATFKAVFSRSLGKAGEGLNLIAFEGDNVHACTAGGIKVHFVNETYTYDTPVPGCATKKG